MKKMINWLMNDEFRAGALMILLLGAFAMVVIELINYFNV